MTRVDQQPTWRSALNRKLAQAGELFGVSLERRTNPRLTIQHLLRDAFPRGTPVNYLQIGAHDGTQNDPISTFRREGTWRGILVEPNPRVFARLSASLAKETNARPVNCAVSDRSGPAEFFVVANPAKTNKPEWADQVSSLDREHVRRFLEKWSPAGTDIEQAIETISVPTCSMDSLLDLAGFARLDLLFLDVEGMDFRLLKTFPFERCQPEMIILETLHLTPPELAEIPRFLCDRGYGLWPMGEDLIARKWAESSSKAITQHVEETCPRRME